MEVFALYSHIVYSESLEPLRGEATAGAYSIKDGNDQDVRHHEGIFPIVRYDNEGRLHLLGTGFFISNNGLFATAKHVLNAPFKNGREEFPIGLIQFRPNKTFLHRPILRFAAHPKSDVAVGVGAPMSHVLDGTPMINPLLILDSEIPAINTRVVTFAYPKYKNEISEDVQRVMFEPSFFDGNLIEHLPAGRDRVLLPGQCFRTNIALHRGASGGPVFSPNGRVFGINSTGYDGTDDSYISAIRDIFDLSIDDVQVNNGRPRSVTIRELSRRGHVLITPNIS